MRPKLKLGEVRYIQLDPNLFEFVGGDVKVSNVDKNVEDRLE